MILKILTPLFACYALARVIARYRRGGTLTLEFIAWLFIWSGIAVVVFLPKATDRLASWIGVSLNRQWPEAKRRQFLKHQAGEAPRTGLHFEQEAGGAGERVDEGGVRIFGERSSDFDKPCGLAMHLDQVGGTKGDQACHAHDA